MPTNRSRTLTRTPRLTHIAANGSVQMVDVSAKATTQRRATAQAFVRMEPTTLRTILRRTAKKGDVRVVARVAGIQAAKKAAELIPLCHTLALTHVEVDCVPAGDRRLRLRCTATCSAQTGVEMEALTGAVVAALTVYDMCKAIDRAMSIESVQLLEKSGGRSGHFKRA